jgi:hypothetical protein
VQFGGKDGVLKAKYKIYSLSIRAAVSIGAIGGRSL